MHKIQSGKPYNRLKLLKLSVSLCSCAYTWRVGMLICSDNEGLYVHRTIATSFCLFVGETDSKLFCCPFSSYWSHGLAFCWIISPCFFEYLLAVNSVRYKQPIMGFLWMTCDMALSRHKNRFSDCIMSTPVWVRWMIQRPGCLALFICHHIHSRYLSFQPADNLKAGVEFCWIVSPWTSKRRSSSDVFKSFILALSTASFPLSYTNSQPWIFFEQQEWHIGLFFC